MDQQHSAFEADIGSWHHLAWRVLDARTYWVCHPAAGGARSRRASDLIGNAIKSLAHGPVWEHAPALYVFDSYATIDYIAWCLKALRKVKDTVLIGSFTHQEFRILGPVGDSRIFDLVPFAKSRIGRQVSKRAGGGVGVESEQALFDLLRSLTQEGEARQTPATDSLVLPSKEAADRSAVA
jgi:hypothetical protein